MQSGQNEIIEIFVKKVKMFANVYNVNYINVMNVNEINNCLLTGKLKTSGLFPHLELLKQSSFIFNIDFGLKGIPQEPGIILLRGARQYGKSTWLEHNLKQTIKEHSPGSALYLNGDEIRDEEDLFKSIKKTVQLFDPSRKIKRLFIDEITAVKNWQHAVKRCADAGIIRDILVITTGSKASDLRHGSERLPGRKGKLARTSYYFTPVSYKEFKRVCGKHLGENALHTYLISGGCPITCSELATIGRIPEYIPEMIRDWINGECAAKGKQRASLLAILETVIRYGGNPCGQAKLAREAGMANNTVAASYIELLQDLICIGTSFAWDSSRKIILRRKPCKYHFVNLLSALSFLPTHIRTTEDFKRLSPQVQGVWYEWIVAQELWRRAVINGKEFPEMFSFWQSQNHEIDFVTPEKRYIEVKRGRANPFEFSWFPENFPNNSLTVINENRFTTSYSQGITLEDFLLESD